VLSSAYGEGTPNVLAEAIATGIPCVATNVGDAAALVEDSGIVISPQDQLNLQLQSSVLSMRLRKHEY
jgi:glycosyltransferase involved in cell wall biosynthesis